MVAEGRGVTAKTWVIADGAARGALAVFLSETLDKIGASRGVGASIQTSPVGSWALCVGLLQ